MLVGGSNAGNAVSPFYCCWDHRLSDHLPLNLCIVLLIMTSMAATLAASLPRLPVAPIPQPVTQPNGPSSTKVPQRMEGVVDVEGAKEVETVNLNSLVSPGPNLEHLSLFAASRP